MLEGSPPSVSVKEQRTLKENVDTLVVIRGKISSQVGNMKVWHLFHLEIFRYFHFNYDLSEISNLKAAEEYEFLTL